MAKSQTNAGELFLSRLSETFICRPGDNVLLECYVRHQRVKSVVWYAHGELVDPRGFRMWHRYIPTTGQCTFYIRSVLYSDDGTYCCEATSEDGIVEQLEIQLKIEHSKISTAFVLEKTFNLFVLDDKLWTKIPVLIMSGHVVQESKIVFEIYL